MATDARIEMTTAELLHFYMGLRLKQGDRQVPIQQMLADFPKYLRQRESMRAMIREADDAIAEGRSGPLDVEQAIHEVVRDLAAEGITE
jgi:hypothetical protein